MLFIPKERKCPILKQIVRVCIWLSLYVIPSSKKSDWKLKIRCITYWQFFINYLFLVCADIFACKCMNVSHVCLGHVEARRVCSNSRNCSCTSEPRSRCQEPKPSSLQGLLTTVPHLQLQGLYLQCINSQHFHLIIINTTAKVVNFLCPFINSLWFTVEEANYIKCNVTTIFHGIRK